MKEFKGTPGPWEVINGGDIFGPLGGQSGDAVSADASDGWQVAEVGYYSAFVSGELVEQGGGVRKANLALLLASEELLYALQDVRGTVQALVNDGYTAYTCQLRKIDAAIAKALGEDHG